MDCQSTRELMAGWIDEQLSPGQHELMAEHLVRCPACSALLEAMETQDLRPPRHVIHVPGLWDRMDQALAAELEQAEAEAEPPAAPAVVVPPQPWRLQVGWPTALLYAALLTLAVGWGLHTQQALQSSRAETAALQRELEREKRLASQPTSPPPEGYRFARGTSSRGTL